MKLRGPIITLAAVVVLGLVLLFINLSKAPDPAADQAAAASTTSEPAPTAAAVAFPAKAKYTGYAIKKDGTKVPIAITVDGAKVKAYVCDGKTVEAWLQGTQADGVLKDVKGKYNNKLEGKLEGGTLKGQVTLRVGTADVVWPYDAAEAKVATAGLYRASSGGQTTGWIVQPDGSQTGLRSTADGAPEPAPQLDPNNLGSAKSVDGSDSVVNP